MSVLLLYFVLLKYKPKNLEKMETLTKDTVSRTNTDTTTRELNARAREQAKLDMLKPMIDMANGIISKGKPETVGKAKQTTPKPVKVTKVPRVSMAGKLDEIIAKGGTWEQLVKRAEAVSKELGGHVKYNKGVIWAHIKYRTVTQKKADYLGDNQVTDEGIGIEKVVTKKGKK